jgi:hypothetical protein
LVENYKISDRKFLDFSQNDFIAVEINGTVSFINKNHFNILFPKTKNDGHKYIIDIAKLQKIIDEKKVGIIVKTQNQAVSLGRVLKTLDLRWRDNNEYTDENCIMSWNLHKNNTYFIPWAGMFGNMRKPIQKNSIVFESFVDFEDISFEKPKQPQISSENVVQKISL